MLFIGKEGVVVLGSDEVRLKMDMLGRQIVEAAKFLAENAGLIAPVVEAFNQYMNVERDFPVSAVAEGEFDAFKTDISGEFLADAAKAGSPLAIIANGI